LVINVVVKLAFSLRRLRLAEGCARYGRLSVHGVHPNPVMIWRGHTWGTAASTAAHFEPGSTGLPAKRYLST
jgi:hypothetical protein